MSKKPELTKKQRRAAELAARAEARKTPQVPVTFEGDAGLVLPDGLPCNFCGKPVSPRKGLLTIVEKVPGEPRWSVLHPECARRRDG